MNSPLPLLAGITIGIPAVVRVILVLNSGASSWLITFPFIIGIVTVVASLIVVKIRCPADQPSSDDKSRKH